MKSEQQERDPQGLDPHTPGAKLDAGKVMAGLMMVDFAHALTAIAEVTTYGAEKYTPSGWKKVRDANNRYLDALQRHLLAYYKGENNDPVSGLDHLAHAAWNILAILEMRTHWKEATSGTKEDI